MMKTDIFLRPASLLLLLAVAATMVLPAQAQRKAVDRSTDILCLAPSATGLIAAIVHHDKKGILQLGLSTATGLAVNYGLELAIHKPRPDGSGNHAFPSTHTMAAFNGATFLMRRYGWKWGVPAYAVSTYVAWGRHYARKHDWWDIAAGAALGAGCTLIYTRPLLKEADLTIAPASFGDDGKGITATLVF